MNNVGNNCCVLVCSCDNYDDLWYPFFTLFSKYWENCKHRIYLNTENKNYSFENLNIKCLHQFEKEKISWSKRLKEILSQIEEEYIIMFLDDFFILSSVKEESIESCVKWMNRNRNIGCIRLKQFTKYDDVIVNNEFSENPVNYEYSITTQASLWRKEFLYELLRDNEGAWEFEYFGSGRYNKLYSKSKGSWKIYKHRSEFDPIINYCHWPEKNYGVMQGKWCKGTVELFAKENIFVDFSKRGFVGESVSSETSVRKTFKEKCYSVFKNPLKLFSVPFSYIRYSKIGNEIRKKIILPIRRNYFNK